ncbi:MAG: hypothetical protein PUA62_10065, partial [Lachnospiraceae bacterium]|nr:hypothetical protein [Lachnospiraceae bacterium]
LITCILLTFSIVFIPEIRIYAEEYEEVTGDEIPAETGSFELSDEATGYGVPLESYEMDATIYGATTPVPTEAEAYQKMIAMKSSYPEGMTWTNANYYAWKGGVYTGGYGCAGFSFLLSDAAFGDLPATMIYDITISDVRVGDILRINNDAHSVIVLEVYSDHVVIAEGNYNSSIHWGRTLTAAEVANATYMMTRYPVEEYDTGDGFKYVVLGNAVKITDCYLSGDIVIPERIDGKEVKYLADQLFYGEYGVTSVSLPATIQEIGKFSYIFSYCYDLQAINVDPRNANYCSIDGVLYSKDKTVLYNYPVAKLGSEYTTPQETKLLCCTSFAAADYLKRLTLSNKDCVWNTYTFYSTPNLKVVYYPGGQTKDCVDNHVRNGLSSDSSSVFPTYVLINDVADDDEEDEAAEIIDNVFPKEYSVTIQKGKKKYEFTPAQSGEYMFASNGDVDSMIQVYDEYGRVIASDDDSGWGTNYKVVVYLNAGETYYVTNVLYSDDEGTFTMFCNLMLAPCAINEIACVDSNGGLGVRLAWSPVAGAEGYEVYRKDAGDDSWYHIVNVGTTSYEDTYVEVGEEYSYSVVPYTYNGYPLANFDEVGRSISCIDMSNIPVNPRIFVMQADKDKYVAGLALDNTDKSQFEYSWYAKTETGNWFLIQDWTQGYEWLDWTPSQFGTYIVCGKARVKNHPETEVATVNQYDYHPHIKGKCQMPYHGELGDGYLIGVESYNNPNQSYQYEMLILDCTLLQQGKPAWVYTTGRYTVSEGNAGWTVWTPQYGYYWTLFRVYDANGNMIDEQCYGFQNI